MSFQLSRVQEKKLGRLLARGFTKKQMAILDSISRDESRSLTSASKKISEERKIPLSTVKLDLKIFEQLDLIKMTEKDGFKKMCVTKFGKTVLGILSAYYNNITNHLSLLTEMLFSFSTGVLQR